MSDLTNVFTDIADAIRAKTETQITYKPTEMANAINNISSGGGVLEITTGRINTSFNMPVNISDDVLSLNSCFYGFNNFNQPVIIPSNVVSMRECFYDCFNFNQPLNIPNRVETIATCFLYCESLNCYVNIPDSVTNLSYCFKSCYSFNQPVHIPDNTVNMVECFNGCRSFNQPLVTVKSARWNMAYCLRNCSNFGSNLYINSTYLDASSTKGMLSNCNNSLSKHIFCNNAQPFLGTTTSASVTGTTITWTQDGDNYYNTTYNIYIHNVANPYVVLNNESYIFDQSSPLPDSPAIVFGSGVRDLSYAFYDVTLNSNNTLILFEEGVEDLSGCFEGQTDFNQPLTIPSSAVECEFLIRYCPNFNSPVVFRNGVIQIAKALTGCENFASDIWIPESVQGISSLLDGISYASGTVHISHNIALGNTDNYIYNSLVNGYIGTTLDPSRILNDY